MEVIKVCTSYRHQGEVLAELPSAQAVFAEVEPVYEEFPGWKSDISRATSVNDLPQEAIDYLNFIVRQVHVPIALISVGSQRQQTIKVPHPDARPAGEQGGQ